MFLYEQKTGRFYRDGQLLGVGYAGNGIWKNDPDSQAVHSHGPCPVGIFTMSLIVDAKGQPCDHADARGTTLKAPVIRLTPSDDTEMFGRGGMLIHGDSVRAPGTASDGCVVQSHDVREFVADRLPLGETTLEVVRGDVHAI